MFALLAEKQLNFLVTVADGLWQVKEAMCVNNAGIVKLRQELVVTNH